MREIRFRGKEHTGEWITGGYVQKNGAPHIVAHIVDRGVDEWRTIPVIPASVGQFTGLRDAKGVEIYTDISDVKHGLVSDQYPYEFPRTVKGGKNRAARIKALGNAVVPQQAYPFFRAISEMDEICGGSK